MGRINNLDEDPMAEVIRRLTALERAAPVGFTTVSRGALRIISSEGLIVEGSARISGVLDGDGNLSWTGPITFTGPFAVDGVTIQNGDYTVNGPWHLLGNGEINGNVTIAGNVAITGPNTSVTGPFHIAGNTDITGNFEIRGPSTRVIGPLHVEGDQDNTGTLAIKGVTTLENDLNVINSGRVKVGKMTLNPAGGETGNGALTSATVVELTAPTVVASGAIFARGNITAEGNLYAAGATTTTNPPNVYMDLSGRIQRCV